MTRFANTLRRCADRQRSGTGGPLGVSTGGEIRAGRADSSLHLRPKAAQRLGNCVRRGPSGLYVRMLPSGPVASQVNTASATIANDFAFCIRNLATAFLVRGPTPNV